MKVFVSIPAWLGVASLIAVSGCRETESTPSDGGLDGESGSVSATGCELSVPGTYESANYEVNAKKELSLRDRFAAFTKKMKDAEASLEVKPSAEDLKSSFAEGEPSLKSLTSAYYQQRVDEYLTEFAAAAGKNYTPAEPPPAEGGLFGQFIFTARGTDLRQTIEKGMFGATFYGQAAVLAKGGEGPVTEATIDRLVALFGAHPSFPNDDKAAGNPDVYSAAYAERRDKKDVGNPGPYLKIKQALVTAKAAAARGAACDVNREAALKTFRSEWERSLFATVIFYLGDVSKKIGSPSPTPADQASALHGLGEAIGFVHGFRELPAEDRSITDAQIDEVLRLLEFPPGGTPGPYKLVTEPATTLANLQSARTKVAEIYGFSQQDVESFGTNN